MVSALETAAVLRQQRANWDAVAAGWRTWTVPFERGAAVVTDRLVALGGVAAGRRVLDLGTGAGEPARTAAGLVAPDGRVVGVDPSPVMIEAARERCAGLGVDFVVGDVAAPELADQRFDTVLARWSLMFAADRVDNLAKVRRLLVPGGVLAAAVWGPPPAVPMISLGFAVVSAELALAPPPPGPGPFTMADPEQVVAEFTAAGLRDVTVHEQVVPFVLDSVDDFVRFTCDVLPPRMRQVIQEHRGSVDDPAVWAAVGRAARRFVNGDGRVELPSTAYCVRAVAPGAGG
ncbi:class I SAM-dependent methyltransferase [Polymorphospora sp. NPDC050346]|uniref:class I SAM-dependent methyltransferase n=1 Tax=Polymorphospora sp. NPDC050346 TaxID=3155780 RepID=UPI0033C2AEAE